MHSVSGPAPPNRHLPGRLILPPRPVQRIRCHSRNPRYRCLFSQSLPRPPPPPRCLFIPLVGHSPSPRGHPPRRRSPNPNRIFVVGIDVCIVIGILSLLFFVRVFHGCWGGGGGYSTKTRAHACVVHRSIYCIVSVRKERRTQICPW